MKMTVTVDDALWQEVRALFRPKSAKAFIEWSLHELVRQHRPKRLAS